MSAFLLTLVVDVPKFKKVHTLIAVKHPKFPTTPNLRARFKIFVQTTIGYYIYEYVYTYLCVSVAILESPT